MIRRAACLAVVIALGGCKDPILLHDLWDGGSGPDAGADHSAWWDPDAVCRTTQELHFKSQSAEVLILLDRSSAMQGPLSGATSRAAGVQNVLTKYINTHQNYIKFGFEEFPDTDYPFSTCSHASCCAGAVVDPQYNVLKHLQQDMGYLDCSDPECLSGSPDSPSHKALGVANDYFNKQNPTKDSEQYVLLITASEPACASEGSANDACHTATTAATGLVVDQEIPLVILTVGYQPSGSSCLVTLSNLGSKVAVPGAVPRLSSATNLDLLDGTILNLFDGIGDSLCTLSTNDPVPVDANLSVWLAYTYTQVPRVDCGPADGWCFPSANHNQITLLGRYCDSYLNMQQNGIYVTYPSCDSTSRP